MLFRSTSCLLALAAAAIAQNDFDLDKTAAGTLGGVLGLQVRNAPSNALLLVMPSFTGGPTALATFDPTDTRSVQVGLDLSANWFTLFTSPTGTAAVNANVPNNTSFQGLLFHWQTLTAPGATHLVDKISNDVLTQLGTANQGAPVNTALAAARTLSAAVATPGFNAGQGDVMVAGGGQGTLTAATGLATTEIWDFRHLRARSGPTMNSARAVHVTVPLTNGRTLLIGGVDAVGTVLATCELYDPTTNSFLATGSMALPRVMHAATRLPDGRVLVGGGTSSLFDLPSTITGVTDTCEIYNPTTGTWSGAAPIGGRRLGPALTTTNNNRVLVSGGVQVTLLFGVPIAAASTTAVQIYNPATNAWSGGPAMPAARAGHHFNQVALADGRVLMTGGINVPDLLNAQNAAPIANADLYNPATNTWTAVNMPRARSLHSATRLPSGDILVCGGSQGTFTAPVSIANVDRFNAATSTWTTLAPLSTPRSAHVAWLQPDGLLVLIGGQGATTTTASIEALHF
ncbi:MAG: hypothetical protein IPK26_28960 [Planctomycetes bacterium]|nr:hypothetical protein [Planctomycetota bacterium]